jgi:hypothetical protein
VEAAAVEAEAGGDGGVTLRLPCHDDDPVPSPHLAHAVGHTLAEDLDAAAVLRLVTVPAVRIAASQASAVLEALEERGAPVERDAGNGENGRERAAGGGTGDGRRNGGVVVAGAALRFYAAAARFLRRLLAQQRFVPMLAQDPAGGVEGLWQPWLADKPTMEGLERLLSAMPPIARSGVDAFSHEAWPILEDFLLRVGDATCRGVMLREEMAEALEDRDGADPHVLWLRGLLGPETRVEASYQQRNELVKRVRRWLGGLEERAVASDWRLCLQLSEPFDLSTMGSALAVPGDTVRWTLSLHLENVQHPGVILDAADIWSLSGLRGGGRGGAISVEGQRVESPHETLLAELARAARLYKPLERLLDDPDPSETDLSTVEAYRFLREIRPILIEQGVSVRVPEWWDSPTIRLGARLQVDSDPLDFEAMAETLGAADATVTRLGMHSLVSYNWQLAVGDTLLTLEEFEKLAGKQAPLVMLDGRWVEIRPEDVKAAVRFLKENPGGQIEVGRALRLAYGTDPRETGLPILGMDATGWVDAVFGSGAAGAQPGVGAAGGERLPTLNPPDGFVGTLRPYQVKGMSWMAFMDRLGLGICLADDMGLGKTVQLLALLLHEKNALREIAKAQNEEPGNGGGERLGRPTLLVVPMSVVANWVREARRFTPQLKVHVHHGLDRPQGAALIKAANQADMVVTTYALAHRDRDDLGAVDWARVVLDEAQNIKNPAAKQSRAIRSIDAPRRIALTGTPVENRLGELWAIMDFLNKDYFGPSEQFRRKFAVPIERYHDRRKADQLRGLVQPFILRRLKSDPNVITDLPEKVESKEYCYLTAEQATLYQRVVADMLSAAEKVDGIQRRGVVLAGLIKLKQICNHPAHFMKEAQAGANGAAALEGPPVSAARSGKCARLIEMLQEVLAAGDQALVFTQFRQAGHLLAAMLRHDLDREVLFLHGGTPGAQREKMIETFQRADGAAPIFILSLKAGGIGLNLTAANHVFHFDRWWNPAVEAQATDRAYRIGQTRTVQVHKFIVSGTLEERIDEMIESKVELAEQVIGSGEQWLTELDGNQLRDLLTLRSDAVGDDA